MAGLGALGAGSGSSETTRLSKMQRLELGADIAQLKPLQPHIDLQKLAQASGLLTSLPVKPLARE